MLILKQIMIYVKNTKKEVKRPRFFSLKATFRNVAFREKNRGRLTSLANRTINKDTILSEI
jgi:hypothetical protein